MSGSLALARASRQGSTGAGLLLSSTLAGGWEGQQAGQHRGGAAADQHLALAGGWEGREEWVEAMKSGKSERRPLKSGKRLRHGCQCRHHDS